MNNPRTLRFNMMIKESVTNKGKKMQAASVHARMIETLIARELRRCLRGVRGGDVRFLLDRLRGGLSSSLLMLDKHVRIIQKWTRFLAIFQQGGVSIQSGRSKEKESIVMTSLVNTEHSVVQLDAASSVTVTNAIETARQAAYKYNLDHIPYPKCCAECINKPTCKKPNHISELLDLIIPVDQLSAILQREETFRLSPQIQSLYDEFKHPPSCIEGELQARALEEFGYCRCYLNSYWRTSQKVKKENHPEVWNSVVYLRYFDRYIDSWLVPCKERNQKIPEIPLVRTELKSPTTELSELSENNQTINMLDQYHTMGRPLVVVSGSQS